jgi:hypothetical protein
MSCEAGRREVGVSLAGGRVAWSLGQHASWPGADASVGCVDCAALGLKAAAGPCPPCRTLTW